MFSSCICLSVQFVFPAFYRCFFTVSLCSSLWPHPLTPVPCTWSRLQPPPDCLVYLHSSFSWASLVFIARPRFPSTSSNLFVLFCLYKVFRPFLGPCVELTFCFQPLLRERSLLKWLVHLVSFVGLYYWFCLLSSSVRGSLWASVLLGLFVKDGGGLGVPQRPRFISRHHGPPGQIKGWRSSRLRKRNPSWLHRALWRLLGHRPGLSARLALTYEALPVKKGVNVWKRHIPGRGEGERRFWELGDERSVSKGGPECSQHQANEWCRSGRRSVSHGIGWCMNHTCWAGFTALAYR